MTSTLKLINPTATPAELHTTRVDIEKIALQAPRHIHNSRGVTMWHEPAYSTVLDSAAAPATSVAELEVCGGGGTRRAA